MARKARRPTKSRARRSRPASRPRAQRRSARSARPDAFDDFVTAAARALALPAERAWLPAIKANLRVTLEHAAAVAEFPLPDDAEPAPVFRA